MSNFKFHIFGAGRGGTSLLAGVLDAHPQVRVMIERHSIAHLCGRAAMYDNQPISGAEEAAARVDNFIAACNAEAALSPDLMFGHKSTTEQVGALRLPMSTEEVVEPDGAMINDEILWHFAQRVSNARVIFILRDGRTCVRSKMRRAGRTVEKAVAAWRYSVTVHNVMKRICPLYCEVKFESLITRPADEMQRICEFLEIEYVPEMLNGTNNPAIRKEYRRMGFDSDILTLDGCDDWAGREMRDELLELGYI
ncbi:MAG TPA: sulfotransferase [Denitromonas sp.]|nr:sulfotransferase [Denitromonas sp.]